MARQASSHNLHHGVLFWLSIENVAENGGPAILESQSYMIKVRNTHCWDKNANICTSVHLA